MSGFEDSMTLDTGEVRFLLQVGRNHVDVPAVGLLDLIGDRLQAVGAPRDENEIVAARSEAVSVHGADAGRGPGDNRDFLGIRVRHKRSPVYLSAQ
jgi:hypothetical protein